MKRSPGGPANHAEEALKQSFQRVPAIDFGGLREDAPPPSVRKRSLPVHAAFDKIEGSELTNDVFDRGRGLSLRPTFTMARAEETAPSVSGERRSRSGAGRWSG